MAPRPQRLHGNSARQRGLTLVEMALVLAIASILAGGGLQGFEQMRLAKRLESLAALLRTDIQYARSTSVATGQPVRLHVEPTPGGGSCYLLYPGELSSCTCTGPAGPSCTSGAEPLRVQRLEQQDRVSLSLNVRSLVFDGSTGTVTPTGTFEMRNAQGDALKVVVNVMGRARTCLHAGRLSAYAAC